MPDNMFDTNKLRTLGVVVALLASAFTAGPLVASAATDGSIVADPATAGSTATHSTTVTVDGDAAGSSWNSLEVAYGDSGGDVSNVGQGDIVTIGIDRGDDADGTTVDESVADDVSSVSASDDGSTLTVGLGGNYQLQAGDELVVVFEDAQNPTSTGEYEVDLTVNAQSAATTATATLAIESADGDDGSSGDDGTDGDDGTNGDDTDGDDTDGDNGTDGDDGTAGCECVDGSIAADAEASNGSSVTVDEVSLSDGGFVAIYDEDGNLVGVSEYLEPGTHEDVTVSLDEELRENTTLTATAYCDVDDDEEFDAGSGDDSDAPYTDGDGNVSTTFDVSVDAEC